jgi:hypothetical protein
MPVPAARIHAELPKDNVQFFHYLLVLMTCACVLTDRGIGP